LSNSDTTRVPSGLPKSPVPLDLCGMADTAKLLGDSWTLLILREVFYGVTRFDDLKRELAISTATLSNRTMRLIELGLIEKRTYRIGTSRPRSEYMLTQAGRNFGPVLFAMMEWADTNLSKEKSPLDLVDPRTGQVLRLALVDEDERVIDWKDAVPMVRTAAAN